MYIYQHLATPLYSKELEKYNDFTFMQVNCTEFLDECKEYGFEAYPIMLRSGTIIDLNFILFSHTQLEESLQLDGLSLFGQIGGTAGNERNNHF